MKKRVSFLGKAIPVWVIAMLLIASGAGAAVGTVLQGNVVGEMPVAVGQALLTGKPVTISANVSNADVDQGLAQPVEWADGSGDGWWVTNGADRAIGAVRDDHTAFQYAAEIDTGDVYGFRLPLKNASDEALVGKLILDYPDCFTVEVMSDAHENVGPISRLSLNSWKFALGAGAEYVVDNDSLYVVVAADDTCAPGFYEITGTLEQISYQNKNKNRY